MVSGSKYTQEQINKLASEMTEEQITAKVQKYMSRADYYNNRLEKESYQNDALKEMWRDSMNFWGYEATRWATARAEIEETRIKVVNEDGTFYINPLLPEDCEGLDLD